MRIFFFFWKTKDSSLEQNVSALDCLENREELVSMIRKYGVSYPDQLDAG